MTKWQPATRILFPALAIGVATFVWLDHCNPRISLGDDTIYDQMLARDCAELGHCHQIGASASLPGGFYHGGLWVYVQVAVKLLGGNAGTSRLVALVSMALAATILFVMIRRWLDPLLALPAVILFVGILGSDESAATLVVPAASVLPNVLTAAGLLCFVRRAERKFLIAAAFALGLAISAHLASFGLVPSFLAMVVLVASRPIRDLIAAAAIAAGIYFLTSRSALLANLSATNSLGWQVPAIAASLLLILAAAAARSHFQRLGWPTRAWLTGFALVLPFAALSLWLISSQQRGFVVTYLPPVLAPAVSLVAALIALPFRLALPRSVGLASLTTSAVAVVVARLVASFVVPPPAPAAIWTHEDTKAISGELGRRGWSYDQLVFRIQSHQCRELATFMAVDAPPPPPTLAQPSRRHLQVVKVSADQAAHLKNRGALIPGEQGQVMLVREIESWLEPEKSIICRRRPEAAASRECAPAQPPNSLLLTPRFFSFRYRTGPALRRVDWQPPFVTEYQIPLSPTGSESRELTLLDDSPPGCRWRVTRVDGMQVEGTLPAQRIRLHSDNRPGLLLVEKEFGSAGCGSIPADNGYPPCIFETEPGDALASVVGER